MARTSYPNFRFVAVCAVSAKRSYFSTRVERPHSLPFFRPPRISLSVLVVFFGNVALVRKACITIGISIWSWARAMFSISCSSLLRFAASSGSSTVIIRLVIP